MTFQQARAIAKANKMHVRRASWAADKWFMPWRGTWFVFGTGLLKPVRAIDYTSADLRATDWTTVPAPLAACPVTPGEPGGGGDPIGGFPGYPSDPPPSYPTPPGVPGGGGGGSGSLPPADAGTSITVEFDGIEIPPDSPDNHFFKWLKSGPPNGPKTARYVGPNHWANDRISGGKFNDSYPSAEDETATIDVFYGLDVTRDPDTKLFTVGLYSNLLPAINVFMTAPGGGALRKDPIPNDWSGNFYGGTARVI